MPATTSASPLTVKQIRSTLEQVFDPEYPDISVVDLGLVQSVEVSPDGATIIGLIPTFSGCPALAMIAADVREAVESLDGANVVSVQWLSSPIWSTERITADAKQRLSTEYTVVLRRKDGTLLCPVCGSTTVQDQSMAGPTRCRSIAWCSSCRNPVEVMR
jgi:ring-1,2-phenylacetyl-CoA epoxidase subunit PaaD